MTGRWHVLSPRPSATGRGPLCGAEMLDEPYFDSPNEVYMAHIEGWRGIGLPCKACVAVFAIAIKADDADAAE